MGTRSQKLQQPSPLYELPGLQDRLEPGVEFFVRRHLVEKAAVDEPDLAGVADFVVVSEKRDATVVSVRS